MKFSLTGDRFPIVADLAENILSRNKEEGIAVKLMIGPAAPKSMKEPSGSAAEELTVRVAELKAKIARIVKERNSEFSRMFSENRSLREETVRLRSEVADIAEINRHLHNENRLISSFRTRDVAECFMEFAAGVNNAVLTTTTSTPSGRW